MAWKSVQPSHAAVEKDDALLTRDRMLGRRVRSGHTGPGVKPADLASPEVHRPDRAAVAVEAPRHEAGAGHLERAVHDDRAVRRRVEPRLERGADARAAAVDLDDLAEHVEAVARVDARRVAEVAVGHLAAGVRSRRVGEAGVEANLPQAVLGTVRIDLLQHQLRG